MRSKTTVFWLNAAELAVLIDFGGRRNLTGGFESLVKQLAALVDKATGRLELEDALLGRTIRYAVKYGTGGFQDTCLRPVLRRALRL
jgi:hypothetical protein